MDNKKNIHHKFIEKSAEEFSESIISGELYEELLGKEETQEKNADEKKQKSKKAN